MNRPQQVAATARSILVDGLRRDAESGREIDVLDPGSGEVIGRISAGGAPEIDLAVAAARRALEGPWGALDALQRGRLLMKLAALIEQNREELADLECLDTGKPIRQARADADFCARYFEFYGTAADKLLGETIPFRAGFTVLTIREPYGVTGHIVPWNYPLQIMGRSVGAALAAGNCCVVKPAEDASLSILRVAELALEAGLPAGAFNVVTGFGREAGSVLAGHAGIDHISFTGSPATGAAVQAAAAAHNVGVTMELGGKSAQVVFADADLDAATPAIVNGIIQNAGQTCSAGSRVIVERSAFAGLIARLRPAFAAVTVGHGRTDPGCGPIINGRQAARVKSLVETARRDGIGVLAEGGALPADQPGGFYVRPVVLGPAPPDHPIAQEEVFGPVLTVIPFEGEEEAVRIANGTPYGLVAGVWTRDGARQMRMMHRLKAGQVYINNYGAAGGVELPFGGVRRSGFGREKGLEGLKSFTVLKTAAFRHG